jgi:hypothetical protein
MFACSAGSSSALRAGHAAQLRRPQAFDRKAAVSAFSVVFGQGGE